MKITKKLISLVLILSMFVCYSCSDKILQEDLYSQVGTSNVNGAEGSQLLTNGLYTHVQFFSYSGGNNYLLTYEANTDEFFCNWGGLPATGWAGKQNFLNLDPGHYQVSLIWNSLYKLIAQANEVISNYGDSKNSSVMRNVAEARFWRAYAYTKLYYLYGPVPIVDNQADLSSEIARPTRDEMESFIEKDLINAENTLPDSYSSSDYGRPTKWAVKAFLARFYLNKKQWQKASDYAFEVINSGNFSLMSNYEDIFSKDGNSEIILAVNHVAESNKGNKYVALSLEASMANALSISGVSASNGYGMAVPFYNSFQEGDVRIKPFNRNTGNGIAVAGTLRYDNGKPVYTSNGSTQTVQEALNRVITFKFPVQENIPRGEDADTDFPLLRLGETFLTYAEAQNELGNTSVAAEYVNKIRNRAGLSNTTASTQTELRDAILNERGWETYHEGYRREDLVRTGKLLEKVNVKYQYYFNEQMPWADNENRILLPIPTSALQLNSKLEQNPGY